jgi:DNA-binding NtrC family response regulator
MHSAPTKVLLVEDERSVVTRIHTALDCYHSTLFELRWSKDTNSALKQLSEFSVDIILLDISEPNLAGLRCFEQLQLNAPKAIIILLCVKSDEAMARQAISMGAIDFINKNHIGEGGLISALNDIIAS